MLLSIPILSSKISILLAYIYIKLFKIYLTKLINLLFIIHYEIINVKRKKGEKINIYIYVCVYNIIKH